MKNTVYFCGVPLVRVKKEQKNWFVQMREDENSSDWKNIGEPFSTKEQAIEEAPYLCEF
jgi:hypothetical protein